MAIASGSAGGYLCSKRFRNTLQSCIGLWLSQTDDPKMHQRALALLDDPDWMLSAVDRVDLQDGSLTIALDKTVLSQELGIGIESFELGELIFCVPFNLRRRGVESRFVLGGQSSKPDTTLIANIARSNQWLDRIKNGESVDHIADSENTTKKRVQQTLNFAFLAPDIVRDVIAGKQPIGLTSTWIATHELPICWDKQRTLIATL